MEIKSERLILKELTETDLDFIYKMQRNELVYFYEEDKEPTKEQIYEKYTKKITRMSQDENQFFIFIISTQLDRIPIGEIQIQLNWDEIKEWEIGYTLHPDYWGNGYASEASKMLLKYVFENLKAHKVVAFCNANNKKSAALMERIGMKRDGLLREGRLWRNEWCDEFVYSILEKDYLSLSDN